LHNDGRRRAVIAVGGPIHFQLDQKGDLMRRNRITGLAIVVVAALIAGACADGVLRSPSSPSPLGSATEAFASTASIDRSQPALDH
jgi:hypothetical protein